eukprot:sb/3478007/
MFLVLLVACIFGTTLADDKTCTSTCPSYTTCSSLTNGTKYNAFLNGSLVCDSDKDAEIGKLLKSTSVRPYALAGVGLALALVALIGLVLITCRNADSTGAPGSF